MAVYDFYNLLKSTHAGQQFTCGRKKDSESYCSDTDSLSARVTHFAQSHTLFGSCKKNGTMIYVHVSVNVW